MRSTVLLNYLGHGLDELARDRAQSIEFEPARDLDDQPIASLVIWDVQVPDSARRRPDSGARRVVRIAR